MKVIISGPRRLPDRNDPAAPWPHMHIEVNLPELPAEGEHITVNNGMGYTVRRRMWWVDTPRDEGYWSLTENFEAKGTFQTAYLDVLPDGYDEPFTADKRLAEGIERGQENARAEVEQLLDLVTGESHVGPLSAIGLLRNWCREGAAKARERAEQTERRRALTERIMAELQAEREAES